MTINYTIKQEHLDFLNKQKVYIPLIKNSRYSVVDLSYSMISLFNYIPSKILQKLSDFIKEKDNINISNLYLDSIISNKHMFTIKDLEFFKFVVKNTDIDKKIVENLIVDLLVNRDTITCKKDKNYVFDIIKAFDKTEQNLNMTIDYLNLYHKHSKSSYEERQAYFKYFNSFTDKLQQTYKDAINGLAPDTKYGNEYIIKQKEISYSLQISLDLLANKSNFKTTLIADDFETAIRLVFSNFQNENFLIANGKQYNINSFSIQKKIDYVFLNIVVNNDEQYNNVQKILDIVIPNIVDSIPKNKFNTYYYYKDLISAAQLKINLENLIPEKNNNKKVKL